MLRLSEIKLPLAHSEIELSAAILARLGVPAEQLISTVVFKRGVDARKKNHILYSYTLDVTVTDEAAVLARFNNDPHTRPAPDTSYHFVAQAPENLSERPIVIGMGPAGLFAGLLLAQMGFRPLILERGKAVRERTQDTWGLWRKGVLNPESNVQFGEGGAGTFSDGKLYSQIKDPRFLSRKVLDEFVKAGAPDEILVREPSAYRHLQAGWHGGEDARQHTGLGRRDTFPEPRHRHRIRRRHGAGRGAR